MSLKARIELLCAQVFTANRFLVVIGQETVTDDKDAIILHIDII
jgi:hypothetical protein